MEELAIFIIIYAVFLIGESPTNPTKKKPVVDDDPWDSWVCGTCGEKQKLID